MPNMTPVLYLFFALLVAVGVSGCGTKSLTLKVNDELSGSARLLTYVRESQKQPTSITEANEYFRSHIEKAAECGAKSRAFFDAQEKKWALVTDVPFQDEDDLKLAARCVTINGETPFSNVTLKRTPNTIFYKYTLEFDANLGAGSIDFNDKEKISNFTKIARIATLQELQSHRAHGLPEIIDVTLPGKMSKAATIANSALFYSLGQDKLTDNSVRIYIYQDFLKIAEYIEKYNCNSPLVQCTSAPNKGTMRIRLESEAFRTSF